MNVLLIGSGGREHALAWKLRAGGKESRRETLMFAAAALAALSPWLIKNAVLY